MTDLETQQREALRQAAEVLGYVSRGRGYVDVRRYPDAKARFALAALVESDLIDPEWWKEATDD